MKKTLAALAISLTAVTAVPAQAQNQAAPLSAGLSATAVAGIVFGVIAIAAVAGGSDSSGTSVTASSR